MVFRQISNSSITAFTLSADRSGSVSSLSSLLRTMVSDSSIGTLVNRLC